MKKLFVSIVLCSALFVTPVRAADIDLSSMTLEELEDLKNQVEAEIIAKGGGEIIGAGLYEAGKDIKAEDYQLISDEEKGSTIILFPSKEAADSDSQYIVYESISGGEEITISLKDGYVLYLDGSLFIKQLEKPSWKPDSISETEIGSETEEETGLEIGAETEVESETAPAK